MTMHRKNVEKELSKNEEKEFLALWKEKMKAMVINLI